MVQRYTTEIRHTATTDLYFALHDELSMTGSSSVRTVENWETEHAFSSDSETFSLRGYRHNNKKYHFG